MGCDENFSEYREWLVYLISRFFRPWGRRLDGRVRWEGEDGAMGTLIVTDNEVCDEPDDAEPSVDDDVRALVAALRGDDASSRLMAARELGRAVDASPPTRAKAIEALESVLLDGALVKAALESLGEIGEPAATVVDSVARLLHDSDHQVRYWATFALGRFGRGAATAIPALRSLVNDPEYGPRYGAIDALNRLEDGA